MKKTVRLRAIWLTVGEIAEMLEALQNAKALKDLDGRQRQRLDDAVGYLQTATDRPIDERVEIPIEVGVTVLQCIAVSQQWMNAALADVGRVDVD